MNVDHSDHAHHVSHDGRSLNGTAWSATLHCLTGCAIGEVLGMVIGTALGWSNGATIALAVVLAFFFGYALTLRPLLSAMSFPEAVRLALAADTASITVMEMPPLAETGARRHRLGDRSRHDEGRRYAGGRKSPQHVVPSYDLQTRWVTNNAEHRTDGSLTPIDPRTGKAGKSIAVDDPYNMYFTPDGKSAIVVAEARRRLDFRDPHTMALEYSIETPRCGGINHADSPLTGASRSSRASSMARWPRST